MIRKDDTNEFPMPVGDHWEKPSRRERMLVGALILFVVIAHLWWAGAALAAAPANVTVKHTRADRHQREMIARVLTQCSRMGAPRKVLIASVATITQESTARNLRGGDGTSVGLFQIIDMHGSVRQRRSPEWAARWFCSRAININHHVPYLTVGELSQRVQCSAHPSAYKQWTREAVRTYRLTLRRR